MQKARQQDQEKQKGMGSRHRCFAINWPACFTRSQAAAILAYMAIHSIAGYKPIHALIRETLAVVAIA